MNAYVDLSGLDRLRERLNRLANPNPEPLMMAWERIIEEDNRRGVLAGTDGAGNPLAPVKYRPVGDAEKTTKRQRGGLRANARAGLFAGFGPHAAGLHGNLSPAEYRKTVWLRGEDPPPRERRSPDRHPGQYFYCNGLSERFP